MQQIMLSIIFFLSFNRINVLNVHLKINSKKTSNRELLLTISNYILLNFLSNHKNMSSSSWNSAIFNVLRFKKLCLSFFISIAVADSTCTLGKFLLRIVEYKIQIITQIYVIRNNSFQFLILKIIIQSKKRSENFLNQFLTNFWVPKTVFGTSFFILHSSINRQGQKVPVCKYTLEKKSVRQ